MAGNTVRAHIGKVINVSQQFEPGKIKVQLFATGSEKTDSLWMPFLYHTDINGYGYHSMPKEGDTVLVIGYGDTSDTYVAMANFWAVGQSPFFTDNKKQSYTVKYKSVDSKVKAQIKDAATATQNISKLVGDGEKEIKSPDMAKSLGNIYANTTLNYQWVIDESDPKNPIALVSTRDGNSIIQLSNSGIDIYDKNAVNIYSEGDLSLGSSSSVNIFSNQIDVQAADTVNIHSGGRTMIKATDTVSVRGDKVYLNTDPDKANPDDPDVAGQVTLPGQGKFKLRVELSLPYVSKDGDMSTSDYVTFVSYDQEAKTIFDDKFAPDHGGGSQVMRFKYSKQSSKGAGQSADEKFLNYVKAFFTSFMDNITIESQRENRKDKDENLTDKAFLLKIRFKFPTVEYAVPRIQEIDDGEEMKWTLFDSKDGQYKNYFADQLFLEKPTTAFDIKTGKMIVKMPVKFPSVLFNIVDVEDNSLIADIDIGSKNFVNIFAAYYGKKQSLDYYGK